MTIQIITAGEQGPQGPAGSSGTAYYPRITLATGYPTPVVTFVLPGGTPEALSVFKYIRTRAKPQKNKTDWTDHKGKRWLEAFQLSPSATTWTIPGDYTGTVLPFAPEGNLLLLSSKPKRFRIGAQYDGVWYLSVEQVTYSKAPRFDPIPYGIGLR